MKSDGAVFAEELAALITRIDSDAYSAIDSYCEMLCAEGSSEECADERIAEPYPVEDAACIIMNSTAEELDSAIASVMCIIEANAAVVECVNGLMACDDEALYACYDTANPSACQPPAEDYQARINMACFPETDFICFDGSSIDAEQVCDGTPDCEDGEDEDPSECE